MPYRFLLACLIVSLIGAWGCDHSTKTSSSPTPANDHGHEGHDHDHDQIDADEAGLSTDDLVFLEKEETPENYEAAVAKMLTLATAIETGFKNNKLDEADGPLHKIGHLLESIESLAKSSDLDDEAKASVGKAVDSLFSAYGALDKKVHNPEKGKDFPEVEESISGAIKTLKDFVKK